MARCVFRAARAVLEGGPLAVAVIHYEASDLHEDLTTLAKLEHGHAAGA